jgi:hypothetical protein
MSVQSAMQDKELQFSAPAAWKQEGELWTTTAKVASANGKATSGPEVGFAYYEGNGRKYVAAWTP